MTLEADEITELELTISDEELGVATEDEL